MLYDLIVAGGGPAGMAAAISAALRGASVLLLERGRFPRHKVCGEFVSAESLQPSKELVDYQNAELLYAALRIPRARLFLDGHILQASIDPPAVSIARFDLDLALWHSAESAGVDARQQVIVQSIAGSGPFRVVTASEEFETRALVNASGRWSNLNLAPAEKRAHHEQMARGEGSFRRAEIRAIGGFVLLRWRLLWGSAGRHRAGKCLSHGTRRCGQLSAGVFAQHPALGDRSRNWTLLSDPVSTSPLIFRDPQPERDGVLMTGDAAGFVDPFVGDGISLALRSGSLAAQCLKPFFAGEASLPDAVQCYSQSYKKSLLPVFLRSLQFAGCFGGQDTFEDRFSLFWKVGPSITNYLVRKTR